LLEIRGLKTYFATDDGMVQRWTVSTSRLAGAIRRVVGESGCG